MECALEQYKQERTGRFYTSGRESCLKMKNYDHSTLNIDYFVKMLTIVRLEKTVI